MEDAMNYESTQIENRLFTIRITCLLYSFINLYDKSVDSII